MQRFERFRSGASLTLQVLCLLPLASPALAQGADSAGAAASSGIGVALSRADSILAQSKLNVTHLKGDVAESLIDSPYVRYHVTSGKGWRPETPRFGRQGIDKIYIRYDSAGRPTALKAVEVKFGSSRLQTTQDGRQLGQRWTSRRLLTLGDRYLSASSEVHPELRRPPRDVLARHRIDVDLPDGREGYFWREDAKHAWKFKGRSNDLSFARYRVRQRGQFISAAGRGEVPVERTLVEVRSAGDRMAITSRNVSSVLGVLSPKKIPGQTVYVSSAEVDRHFSKHVFLQLSRQLPHLEESELRSLARDAARSRYSLLGSGLRERGVGFRAVPTALAAGGLILVFESARQFSEGEFDPISLSTNSGIGLAAGGAGYAAGEVVYARFLENHEAVRAARRLGVGARGAAMGAGALSGASVAGALVAYAGWVSGTYDLATANQIAATTSLGAAGSVVTYMGLFSLVSATGTASTGTAISSLSGVAATNAVMAWFGGGTVAAGGSGVAGGAIVLGGVTSVAGVAVAVTAMYVINLLDQREQDRLLDWELRRFATDESVFLPQARRLYQVRPDS